MIRSGPSLAVRPAGGAIAIARATVALAALLGAAGAACGGNSHRPTCATAATTIAHGMREVRPQLAKASVDPAPEVEKLCKGDRWSRTVIECYAATDELHGLRACSDKLGVVQRTHARDLQLRLYDQAEQATRAATGDTGIPECDGYVAALTELTTCDKVPAAVVEAMEEALVVMRQTWRDANQQRGPDRRRARAAAAAGCRAADDAVRQTAAALGCS